MPVDRDFVFLLNAFDIEPGAYVPRIMEMTDFNLWALEQPCLPGDRAAGGLQERQGPRACRQSDDDEPPGPHARLRFRGDVHGRRLGPAGSALAGGQHRHPRRGDACLRVRREICLATGRSTATSRTTP